MDGQDRLMQHLKDTVKCVRELNQIVSTMPQKEEFFFQNPVASLAEEIKHNQQMISEHYNKSVERVNAAIAEIETLLEKKSSGKTEQALPTKEEIHSLLLNLWKGKPKTRAPPIPNYCGCYAYRAKTTSPNNFICANTGNSFVLMIVYKFENDLVYAYDPDDPNDPVRIIKLTADKWTPLPTIIPEKPLARWEYAKQTKVLALCPTNDTWSTNFYPAVVISRPCDSVGDEEVKRGYKLDFGDEEYIVPEQYVVNFPDNWKPK